MTQGTSKTRIGLSSTTIVYLALALVWGSSFLFVKVGLRGLSPAQVVLARLDLGALALVIIMLTTRRRWPRGLRVWGHLVVLGVLMSLLPFLLFAWCGQYLPSGVSSIINATTPIMTMLVGAVALRSERLGLTRTIGVLVGAVGIVVVIGPWHIDGTGLAIAPQLAALGATLSYGLGGIYLRRFVTPYGMDAPTVAAGQIGSAAVLLTLASPLVARGGVDLTAAVVWSMLALGIAGTGLGYVAYVLIVQRWGATLASTVTYVMPLVGVGLGIIVLHEHLVWNQPVGAVITLAGIVVSQRRRA